MNKYCKRLIAGALAALLMGELPMLPLGKVYTYSENNSFGAVAYAGEIAKGEYEIAGEESAKESEGAADSEGSESDHTGDSGSESSKEEGSGNETSRDETSKDETSKNETSKDETSQNETSKDETSQNETSKNETSKNETSKNETSKNETSKNETSKNETSKNETSKNETSKNETSKSETSKSETSKNETSKSETSKSETSKSETSKEETSKAEETVAVKLKTPALVSVYAQGRKVRLTWKAVKGADGYCIYKKNGQGRWISWRKTTRFVVKDGKITFVGGDLAAGNYQFTVRAYTKQGSKYTFGNYNTTGLKITTTDWDLQTNYPYIAYRNRYGYPRYATIASGGCGAVSVGNIMRNLMGFSNLTTREICRYATACGARYNGGTDIETLLAALQKKYGKFAYRYTEYDATMKNWLQNGGMAVAHSSGYYRLVSSSGHFVVIKGVNANNWYTIFDSYYYEGKWTDNYIRRNYVHTTSEVGKINVSFQQVHRAFNYYWLVQPATIQKSTQTISRIYNIKKGIRLIWKKNSSQATGYKVYRRTGKGPYKLIKTLYNGNVLTYLDKSVRKGKTYSYKVVATNGSLRSKYKERTIRRKVASTKKTTKKTT